MSHPTGPDFFCAAPRPITRAPAFMPPAQACDCHAHVIGQPPAHPFVEARSYTPPEATPADYLANLAGLGMGRGVLVTVSVHGDDNRLMAETVSAHRGRLAGVAVVRPDVEARTLDALSEAGVRALRLNMLFGGGTGLEALEALAPRCAQRGWHLELLIDGLTLPALERRIAALPVEVVIDHMGHLPPPGTGQDATRAAAIATLERLLQQGRTWVKLSGAYRCSQAAPPWVDTLALAQRLVAAAPARCVWGSDWPHVAQRQMPFSPTDTLDWLGQVIPDEAVRHRLLVENPARLYDFPGGQQG
ncbi:MAG: putative metal-dependent hydrolase of the TIM-barrel fold [Rhodobacteraceae bacterium HLUCCA12]|nr:MAG: putative metal-dependent hydrolase of the TIM-barrel fold [Rhodobacteraceae bacterium HLUCCA12]